ncbi:MAG: hypothetical protein HYX84_08030 [Chloroflexi bacterium]|nr:hypothetical protein [Chloroflexota bacterium]
MIRSPPRIISFIYSYAIRVIELAILRAAADAGEVDGVHQDSGDRKRWAGWFWRNRRGKIA